MTIEASVLIWTVICFCAFAFVINTLLFKPVLKVLDARREKIQNAKKRAEKRAFEARQRELSKKERLLAEKTERTEKLRADIENFKEFSTAEVKNLRKQNEQALKAKRDELAASSADTKAKIDGEMETFIALFTKKIVS